MDTTPTRYGRCGYCNEIKHVTAEGLLHEHNGYRAEGTSVAVTRCPGSDRLPAGAEPAGPDGRVAPDDLSA